MRETHEEDDERELLPRQLLTGLIADAEEEREWRAARQVLLLSAGWTLVALGLPTAALLGFGPEVVEGLAASGSPWPHVLTGHAVLALHGATGLGLERAAILISALAAGGTPLAAFVAAGRLGLRGGARVTAAFLVAGAPAAWLAATLPGPAAPGLLGATLLLAALVDPRRPWGVVRVLAWWLVAVGLHAASVLLLPAALQAALRGPTGAAGRPSRTGGARVAGATILVLAVALGLAFAAHPGTPAARLALLVGGAAGPFGGTVEPAVGTGWAVTLVLGPGIVAWLLLQLALHRPSPGESPTPSWVWVWAGGALLAVGAPPGAVPWTALLPLGLLGLAARATRIDAGRLKIELAVMLVLQLGLAGADRLLVERTDPLRSWRTAVVRELEPDDLFLTDVPEHRYLLEQRYDLEVVDLRPAAGLRDWPATRSRIERAAAAGRRLVLDRAAFETAEGRRVPPEVVALRREVELAEL